MMLAYVRPYNHSEQELPWLRLTGIILMPRIACCTRVLSDDVHCVFGKRHFVYRRT